MTFRNFCNGKKCWLQVCTCTLSITVIRLVHFGELKSYLPEQLRNKSLCSKIGKTPLMVFYLCHFDLYPPPTSTHFCELRARISCHRFKPIDNYKKNFTSCKKTKCVCFCTKIRTKTHKELSKQQKIHFLFCFGPICIIGKIMDL